MVAFSSGVLVASVALAASVAGSVALVAFDAMVAPFALVARVASASCVGLVALVAFALLLPFFPVGEGDGVEGGGGEAGGLALLSASSSSLVTMVLRLGNIVSASSSEEGFEMLIGFLRLAALVFGVSLPFELALILLARQQMGSWCSANAAIRLKG